MKRFEYKLVRISTDEKYIESLNSMGTQGWQVVNTEVESRSAYLITFMRELDQDQTFQYPPSRHNHLLSAPCRVTRCPAMNTEYEKL